MVISNFDKIQAYNQNLRILIKYHTYADGTLGPVTGTPPRWDITWYLWRNQ